MKNHHKYKTKYKIQIVHNKKYKECKFPKKNCSVALAGGANEESQQVYMQIQIQIQKSNTNTNTNTKSKIPK